MTKDNFKTIEEIGKGSFGEVWKARDNETCEIVAIKELDLEDVDEDITDVQKEITVLSQCDTPYIIKYYASYIVDTKLWIVMEYMSGGSCWYLVNNDKNYIIKKEKISNNQSM